MWALKIRKSFLHRLLYIFSFLSGLLLGGENHYHFFRLEQAFLEGPSCYATVLDQFWAQGHIRFFPGAFFSSLEIKRELEKTYPVSVSYAYLPWRSCVVRVKPLEAFIQIYWNDVLWNIAKEGRAWKFSQENATESLSLPRIIWGEGLNPPIAIHGPCEEKQRVWNVLAPLDRIERYAQALLKSDLFRKAPAFTLQKKGISFQVLLELENTLIVLDGEKPESWANVDKAIEMLLKKVEKPRKIRIDATYPDKIILQELL